MIRWMLSLTPAERSAVLQQFVNSVERIRNCNSILLGLALLLVASPLFGQTIEKPKPLTADTRITELLEPIRGRHQVPALAAAIVNGKGLVAVGAVGVRKHGTEVAVTIHDQFHLGSDTKAMTATLLGSLIEAGQLQWDTPLEKHFPELAKTMTPELRGVTLEHLLSHYSGLPDDLKQETWEAAVRGRAVRQQRVRLVRSATAVKPMHAPGERFAYSNLNYIVAGAIAEKATKTSWEELLRRRVFEPLAMRSAGFGAPGQAGKVDQPHPHNAAGKPIALGPDADNGPILGPAGRVHSSLPDWAKFIADQLKGFRGGDGLLKAATYRKLQTCPFRGDFYALGGWGGGKAGGQLVLTHDGSNTYNYATALLLPDEDRAVLVVTNQGGDAGRRACEQARERLLRRFPER